jgi:hypothetical protein
VLEGYLDMKTRFYHRWIYWLYYRTWSPIYRSRPLLVSLQIDWMERFLDETLTTKGNDNV